MVLIISNHTHIQCLYWFSIVVFVIVLSLWPSILCLWTLESHLVAVFLEWFMFPSVFFLCLGVFWLYCIYFKFSLFCVSPLCASVSCFILPVFVLCALCSALPPLSCQCAISVSSGPSSPHPVYVSLPLTVAASFPFAVFPCGPCFSR